MDQQTQDVVVEGSKIAGGGGAGMMLLALIQRFLRRSDRAEEQAQAQTLALLTEIKVSVAATRADVGTLSTEVKLLVQAHTATRADVDKLEGAVRTLELKVSALEARLTHLSEGIAT